MRRLLLFLVLLSGLAVPASAQQPKIWTEETDRIRFENAAIVLPTRAGVLNFTETGEFSREGEGLDAAAQFKSGDGEIWGTVYVYLPGVAHPGLAALATSEAIKVNSPTPVEQLGTRVTSAGGMPGVAIRTGFNGYRGELRSSAAFIKADRWLVKFRVSGPQARAAEVEAAMTALLDGIGFEGKAKPAPASLIEAEPCPDEPTPAALPVADDAPLIMQNAIALGGFDPVAALPGTGGSPRIGTRWCRGVVDTGEAQVPFLRALDGAEPGDASGRSVLLVLYSDAGGLLEAVRRSEDGAHVLLNHSIATTSILGMLSGTPSNAQIAAFLAGGGDDVLRTRVTVSLKPNGDSEIQVALPDEAVPTT